MTAWRHKTRANLDLALSLDVDKLIFACHRWFNNTSTNTSLIAIKTPAP